MTKFGRSAAYDDALGVITLTMLGRPAPADLKALEEAAHFVKDWLMTLEEYIDADDPLSELRMRIHAPLHAKLDAALKGVPNV